MEVSRDKRKYKIWFDEICLGKQRIREVGNSFVITIPKSILKKNDLTKGDDVIPILLLRKRKLVGELENGFEWLKMTKKDRIRFKSYLKEIEEIEYAAQKNE